MTALTDSTPLEAPAGNRGRALVTQLRRRHERRRRLLPRALLLGALTGLVASVFRALLERAEELRTLAAERLHPFGAAGFALFLAGGAALVALAVWLVRRFAPEAAGSGIPQLKAVLHRLRPQRGAPLIAVKFIGGIAAIGAGLALGREGPTIQMGGSLGRIVARRLPSTPHERQVLIAAGAGAGLAAAFNAPLAGLVFVLEEIQRNFAPGVFSTTFVACVIADAVSRFLFGQTAVLSFGDVAAPPLQSLPGFALLGVGCGLLGVLFGRGLRRTLALFDRIPSHLRVTAAAGVGLVAAGAAWFVPSIAGGGGSLVRRALTGEGAISLLLLTLVARFALTMASYGTGAPGGIFAPLLVLGASFGLAAGLAPAALGFGGQANFLGAPAAWAITGMAALFAATVRAPLTGIVLMVEMTAGYELMLPLLTATFLAQWTADVLDEPPVYDWLLERELGRGDVGESDELEGALLIELDVHPGAPFANRDISSLGLPSGLLFVALERRGRHRVPTATTRLEVGDRLSIAVSPDAGSGLGKLRAGLGIEGSGSE